MYCILIYPLRFKFIAAIIVTWFALSSPVKLLRTILGHHRGIQGDISSKMYSPLHSYNRKIKHKCFRWRVEAVMPTQGGPGGRGPTHCCDTHHTERSVFVFLFWFLFVFLFLSRFFHHVYKDVSIICICLYVYMYIEITLTCMSYPDL